MADPDQTTAFSEDLLAQPPDRRMRWTCTRCGSDKVLGVSLLDESQRYALASRCTGCKRTLVAVERELPPKKGTSSDA